MYYGVSLLAGMLISVMVVFNGALSGQAGPGLSLVIIHIAGLAASALALLLRREKPRMGKLKPVWYTAGLIGILTTLFNLRAYGHISVSAMMALGLLGESASGLLADHIGFLGHPVRRFRREKLLGLLVTLAGIAIMLTDFEWVAVIVSLLAGLSILLSRLINGRLSRVVGVYSATFINYVSGLSGALLVLAVTGVPRGMALTGPFTNYLGGALGAVIVLICNAVVGRIASFYLTLTLFVGQVTAGLLLDMALTGAFPARTALGGLFVLAGLCLSLLQDRAYNKKSRGGFGGQLNCRQGKILQ